MYQNRSFKKQSVSMNNAKERKRLESEPPDYEKELPFHRKTIIIIYHDFGKTIHILNLYKTNRRDCYKVTCDGKVWKEKIGLSKILQGIRKSLPRVRSI